MKSTLLLGFAASRPLHLSHKGCLLTEQNFQMLSGQNKPSSVLDHLIFFLIYVSKHPYFIHSEVSAPRDERQWDCIVLMMVEWLMMIAALFINEPQDDHSSTMNVPGFQMNSSSPPTLHTSQSIPPTPSTSNCEIKSNLLSQIMDHLREKKYAQYGGAKKKQPKTLFLTLSL